MKLRNKKLLSLLLATAMVFTMNTSVFALEVGEDADEEYTVDFVDDGSTAEETDDAAEVDSLDEFDEYGFVDEINADLFDIEVDAVSPNATPLSGDVVLSANRSLSVNLTTTAYEQLGTSEYFVSYPLAIAYNGKKATKEALKAAQSKIKVYKRKLATASADDIISNNSVNTTAFTELQVKKVSIRGSKGLGATVDVTGKPILPGRNGCYITSIKLSDSTENKALKEIMKPLVKSIKDMKTSGISGNGIAVGGTKVTPLAIAIYPAYAGNDSAAQTVAKELGLKVAAINKIKTKSSSVKSIQVTINGKKETLKPTKKTDKPKGLVSGSTTTCTSDTNSLKSTSYVTANGNFTGSIYLSTSSSTTSTKSK